MSVSGWLLPLLLPFTCLLSLTYRGSSAAPPLCPRSELSGVADAIRSQCPTWIERSFPEEADGDALDKELLHVEDGAYYSLLFHASWCPFSRNIRPIFDALSSMFPETMHLTIEESSAAPSVFSRYGIHSYPTVLLANRTSKIQYHGSKDLDSLVQFYRETTGQDPVAYFYVEQPKEEMKVNQPWQSPAREFIKNEPYLAFSLLFIILRAFTCFLPNITFQLKTFWMSHSRHVNLGSFIELSRPLGRVLHVIDVKRAWSKLRLYNKTRNFRNGAKSARVWASSLASVSLGEPSSSRSTHSD